MDILDIQNRLLNHMPLSGVYKYSVKMEKKKNEKPYLLFAYVN